MPMKSDNRARYADRIDRVLSHLETCDPERLPDLAELAGIAALSPFHFHRIYRIMTGETPADTLRRVRLAHTVPALQDEAVSVTQAAGASGYASSQSFARALKSATGSTSTQLRRDQGLLDQLLKPGRPEHTPMPVEIVSTQPLRLMAIRNVGAYAELNLTYERLFGTVFSHIGMEELRGIWGVWHQDPRFVDASELVFDCAIDVGDAFAPDGEISVLDVAGGRCARLRHVGGYDSLHASIDHLYAHIIDRGEAVADRPVHVNYVDDPESRPEPEWRSDIYLPLE
jgi:AraC family transcriptional regulator